MDYPFEQLTPERFQQLCQSLLVKEAPGVQCFPVAQPDGGRDVIMYSVEQQKRTFILFQVKFVRDPASVRDVRKWLEEIIDKELPKVATQIPKGAAKYVLMTNLAGTAHPGTGRIDILQQALDEILPLPSEAWWRDDLARRLDNAWDLKWIFPEIMTGPDLIRSIVETGLREDQERRSGAMRAYIKDQFERDREVKFKQVELQNRLLDLFIDVPIAPPANSTPKRRHNYLAAVHRHIGYTQHATTAPDGGEDPEIQFYGREEDILVGAGTFLLHPLTQKSVSKLVLEGAPGQGKSTISQYLCQVHRMKILKNAEMLKQIPDHHMRGPVRLPFKIDLRDFANWLNRSNPFSLETSSEVPPNWHRSLEAFLAAHVQHYSGGIAFSVGDLLAVCSISAVLLVFDGLDEVAEIPRRREVINEIVAGVNRLEENASSLQTVITSRPAAFANSPGLPDNLYPYYQLGSVTRGLIDEYTDKWLKARKLTGREAADVRRILKERLKEPHIRDLATNPMQLAILMSLVHTRGISLPDKRTALYDSYVELFFNREAEKSDIVRAHRDLLVNIHRYLGWLLHAEAELGEGNGIVPEERLHSILEGYLVGEGHNPELAGVLFTGMVERVVALVSRVQGTYEFEVQPLREYFAGRYLYETAPYSPPGNERHGTKPDRFDALARNLYWSNVTRFYAGCYSKGELASLIDRIEDLIGDPVFKYTSHARVLAATLLSDWVFTQHPRSVKDVIRLVLDGIGLRFLITSVGRRAGTANPLVLPEQCGRGELISLCLQTLATIPPWEYALDLVDLLKANASEKEVIELWLNDLRDGIPDTQYWLDLGLHLGALSRIPRATVSSVFGGEILDVGSARKLVRAGRFDVLESDPEHFSNALHAVLEREIIIERGRRAPSVLEVLASLIDPSRYAGSWYHSRPYPLMHIWRENSLGLFVNLEDAQTDKWPDRPGVAEVKHLLTMVIAEANTLATTWATALEPWDRLVESLRSSFGDVWAAYQLANVAAGIRSREETGQGGADIFDVESTLCVRARYARLRAAQSTWWKKAVAQAASTHEQMFTLLLLCTWGTTATIQQLLPEMETLTERLSTGEWIQVYDSVSDCVTINRERNRRIAVGQIHRDPWNAVSPRVAALLGLRSADLAIEDLLQQHLHYRGDDVIVNQFLQDIAVEMVIRGTVGWADLLPLISHTYHSGAISQRFAIPRFARHSAFAPMTLADAERVASTAHQYPALLVAIAEAVATEAASVKIVPVGAVAIEQNWFE